MDSLEKEQLFDAITMAISLGHSNTARHIFHDTLKLVRKDVIEECTDLALRKDAFYLLKDIEKMKDKSI